MKGAKKGRAFRLLSNSPDQRGIGGFRGEGPVQFGQQTWTLQFRAECDLPILGVTSFRAAFQLNLPYPSLRPVCLRSAYAADNPFQINIRTASERDKWLGSPLRHSSISCRHSGSSRKLTTGICPV